VDKLRCYEVYDDIVSAIAREKQINDDSSRARKLALAEGMNPEWNDLYHAIIYLDCFVISFLAKTPIIVEVLI